MKRNKLTALAVSVVSVLGALCSCSEGYDKLLDKNDPVTVTVWHYYCFCYPEMTKNCST